MRAQQLGRALGLAPRRTGGRRRRRSPAARPGSARRSAARSPTGSISSSVPWITSVGASMLRRAARCVSCASAGPQLGHARPAPRRRARAAIDWKRSQACSSAAKAGETLTSQPARSARSRSPDIIASPSRCSTLRSRQRAALAAAVGAAERERPHALGVRERELLGDHPAHRDAEHVRGLDAERARAAPAASSAIWAIVISPSRRVLAPTPRWS